MTDFYINSNNYGLILLRDNYEDALEESKEMYEKVYKEETQSSQGSEKAVSYLLGVKENVLSGQIGLHMPPRKPHIKVPMEAISAEHVDNPLWVNYDFINGESKMVLGALPLGQFGLGVVEPAKTRKILEGNYSPELIKQVRNSTRKYTLEVHNRSSELIQEFLKKPDIKERLLRNINADLFEELIADLLRDQGFDVFLTKRTRDGGKDIWASILHEGRRVTALVECKVRGGEAAIDPVFARAVVGTYAIEKNRGINVDCALMVTTSKNVGPETLAIQQTMREFSVKDYDDVLNWMQAYGALRNGLWVPDALSDYLY